MTIWCEGSLQADGYTLYKDRGSPLLDTKVPQASSNKTGFLIQSMSSHYTGLYQCAYSTGGSLSQLSEPLLLVVTGKGGTWVSSPLRAPPQRMKGTECGFRGALPLTAHSWGRWGDGPL